MEWLPLLNAKTETAQTGQPRQSLPGTLIWQPTYRSASENRLIMACHN
jgi:hypothetical protein